MHSDASFNFPALWTGHQRVDSASESAVVSMQCMGDLLAGPQLSSLHPPGFELQLESLLEAQWLLQVCCGARRGEYQWLSAACVSVTCGAFRYVRGP